MRKLKVAAIQLDAELGQVDRNLLQALDLVRKAAEHGAKLIVLP